MIFGIVAVYCQTTINFEEDRENKLYIKLYGHIDYNQKIENGVRHAGNLDVHRLVTLFGYQFSRKTQFVSEIEVEHVKEIFVEQAFVQHQLGRYLNLKAGLLLIPMGMVNEQHEPTFFYSVERPLIDKVIVPSTWREVGFGISGLFPKSSLKYQLYLVNNPLSYKDGQATISAGKGIRSGRQKGAESILTSFPGISSQVEYFGFNNFKTGISFYHGKTNTSLYSDYPVVDKVSRLIIDSSRVKISMLALHMNYAFSNFTTRMQYVLAGFSDANRFNNFSGSDVPDLMHGYYLLASYDFIRDERISLAPFIRYSHLNNELKTSAKDDRLRRRGQDIWTIGLNYKPDPGVVFKIDFQFYKNQDSQHFNQLNSGVGVWF